MRKTTVSQKKNTTLTRRKSGLMALEPRFMFDGAAVAEVANTVQDLNPSDGYAYNEGSTLKNLFSVTEAGVPAVLAQAQTDASKLIADFLQQPNAKSQLYQIFNGGSADALPSEQWLVAFDGLLSDIAQGSSPIRVELLSAAEMQNAFGAFAERGIQGDRVIFLNAEWLQSGASNKAIELVLAEEFGHAIDARLNAGADSAGDEGQAFASLVGYGNANLAATQSQADKLTLNVQGQAVPVEAAANLAIAQTHYVPMSEADIQTALKAINSATTGNIQTVIAITATSNGTVVVYDQWEDGYEADGSNPLQASTKVWIYQNNTWYNDTNLNGVYDNGTDSAVSTTTTNGVKASGASIILSNAVSPTSPTTVDFDGRDKIGSTKAVSVARAGWSATPGTVLAGAVSLIDAGNSGYVYTLPVGQNVETVATGTNKLFEYTSAHIIASKKRHHGSN